jgi:hypothetical protein
MKPREISSRGTLFYKLLPVLFFLIFGIPLVSMYNPANQWGCNLNLRNQPQCQQITPKEISSGVFSRPLSANDQQLAFYQYRDVWTLFFILFFGWTTYLAVTLKKVQIENNELIFSDYFRTARIPFSRIIDAKINSIPRATITMRLMDLSPLGDAVTFSPHSNCITTCKDQSPE